MHVLIRRGEIHKAICSPPDPPLKIFRSGSSIHASIRAYKFIDQLPFHALHFLYRSVNALRLFESYRRERKFDEITRDLLECTLRNLRTVTAKAPGPLRKKLIAGELESFGNYNISFPWRPFGESARFVVSLCTSEYRADAGVSAGEEIGIGNGIKREKERESQLTGYRLAQVRVARELQFGISRGSCRV